MLRFLPAPLKGVLSGSIFILNSIFWPLLLYPFAVLKFLVPHAGFKRWCTEVMEGIGANFVSVNDWNDRLVHGIHWDIRDESKLDYNRSYLIVANHQSWIDIVVLQHVFNRRIRFVRFFVKEQLKYVPFLGWAWLALDFPFMKRYSKEYLARHPEKRGKDLETTRRACERFKGMPIAVLNFLEGTRFTPSKHAKQGKQFRNLLMPKAGGVAFVLEAMGEQFDSILDVTIHYPQGAMTLWDAMCGRLHAVTVVIRQMPVPRDLLGGNYLDDAAFRARVQEWVTKLWEAKDQLLDSLKTTNQRPVEAT